MASLSVRSGTNVALLQRRHNVRFNCVNQAVYRCSFMTAAASHRPLAEARSMREAMHQLFGNRSPIGARSQGTNFQ